MNVLFAILHHLFKNIKTLSSTWVYSWKRKINKDSRNNNNKKHYNKAVHFYQQSTSQQNFHHHLDNDDVCPMEIDSASRNQQKKASKRKPFTESEKHHRLENGLCLYRGDPDHEIDECTVKPAKKTLNATTTSYAVKLGIIHRANPIIKSLLIRPDWSPWYIIQFLILHSNFRSAILHIDFITRATLSNQWIASISKLYL